VSCTVATDGTVKSRSNPERQHSGFMKASRIIFENGDSPSTQRQRLTFWLNSLSGLKASVKQIVAGAGGLSTRRIE
jgi:hypothetical protein